MTGERSMLTAPLLTIAIPTWNRAPFLERNLAQLQAEMSAIEPGVVEVIVSDNCSPDDTPSVVDRAIHAGLPIRYVRNERNLGWALNFAQCFDLARGRHVLMLGDDDLLVDGALSSVVARLRENDYGVVCLRPYGFESDFRLEHPGGTGRDRIFHDSDRFLVATSRFFTLTSACVINKSLLSDVETRQFITSDLAVFHLVLRAALAAKANLYVERYLLASQRQNSFAYEYAKVFVDELWRIIDAHVVHGLRPSTIRRLERDKLISYYPFYLFDLRLSGRGDLALTFDLFASRFRGRALFTYWLAPIILLPRPFALAWGALTTVVGRILAGDLRRGSAFAWHRVRRTLGWPSWRTGDAPPASMRQS